MYLVELKTILTTAMRSAFGTDAPEADFRDLHVSIEYPVERQHYPSIWVDFDPNGPLEISGIGHMEQADPTDASSSPVYRWRFTGMATFTVAAMTSLERDRLFDAVVSVFAFSDSTPALNKFRSMIENNDLIAMNIDFDQIEQRGFAASQGTPWGTDEVVYEATLGMEVVGEFTVTVARDMLPLSQVIVVGWNSDGETDPSPGTGWIG